MHNINNSKPPYTGEYHSLMSMKEYDNIRFWEAAQKIAPIAIPLIVLSGALCGFLAVCGFLAAKIYVPIL